MRERDSKERGFYSILALTVMPEEIGDRKTKCPAFAGHTYIYKRFCHDQMRMA